MPSGCIWRFMHVLLSVTIMLTFFLFLKRKIVVGYNPLLVCNGKETTKLDVPFQHIFAKYEVVTSVLFIDRLFSFKLMIAST
jgi:hypothetical protein